MTENDRSEYQAPIVTDYGRLEELTASAGSSRTVDVPLGTELGEGQGIDDITGFSS